MNINCSAAFFVEKVLIINSECGRQISDDKKKNMNKSS